MTRKEIIGDCTLYLGDCLEILPTLGKVDAVVTDPPYDAKTHDGAIWDDIDFSPLPCASELARLLLAQSRGWILSFCALEQIAAYRDGAADCWVRAGIWDKINPMPQMTGDRPAQGGEGIAIFHPKGKKTWNGGGKAAIYRYSVEHGAKEHPTQKPVALIRELVSLFTQPDDTILDPFMGSGTTLVACTKMGRKGIGIEIEPKYFDIACRRVEDAYKQPDMFIAPPKPMKQEAML